MPTVPSKDLARLPGLQHQLQCLAVALALLDRHDTIRDGGVGRQPGREARNQTPAAEAVNQSVFLGDPRWRAGRGQGRTDLNDRDIQPVRQLGENRAHQARVSHEPVDVLVVLVGAQAVHAGPRGVHHFV